MHIQLRFVLAFLLISACSTPADPVSKDVKSDVQTTETAGADASTPDQTSHDLALDNLAPEDLAIKDLAPEDLALEDVAPDDLALEDLSPQELAPEDLAAEDLAPEDVVSEDLTPEDLVPEDLVTEDLVTEDSSPEDVPPDTPPCTPTCDGTHCGDDGCDGLCSCGKPVNGCYDAVCEDGVCNAIANTMSCDDANPCTLEDTCAAGVCAGTIKDCADADACTLDSCHEDTGDCIHDVAGADSLPCDDGNPCTGSDACTGGNCKGVLLPLEQITVVECLCQSDEDCDALDDNNICNGTLYCPQDGPVVHLCQVLPDSIPNCDDGVTCTNDTCDPAQGCLHEPDDTLCADGWDCTTETCNPLADCQVTADNDKCNDDNDCTDDICDVSAGCQNTPYDGGTPCGQPQGWGTCQSGVCICTPQCENKLCGPDACQGTCGDCDPTQDCVDGQCVSKSCEVLCDGIQCGTAGLQGQCNCGECDDNNPCTIDSCDEDAAWCVFDKDAAIGLACDDKLPCTLDDVCTPQGCKGVEIECDDGNECTMDYCSFLTGICSFGTGGLQGVNCDDGNPCTSVDKCSFGECVGIPKAPEYVNVEQCPCAADGDCAPYEDGNVCNGTPACLEGDLGGHCYIDPATVLDCNDDVECTVDTCNPATGCKNTPNLQPCLDQASCTVDSCDPELGCLNVPDDSKCDDGNPCTAGWCDPDKSCTYGAMPEGMACGEPVGWGLCAKNGVCKCAPVCKEHGCGDDSCGSSCGECGEWGYDCIDGECIADCDLWCQVPECGPAGMWSECDCGACDDGSQCTIDICDEDKKCRHIYRHDEPCDDGSECTADDHCVMAACVGTSTLCDDENECTVDSCDPVTGQCVFDEVEAQGAQCDDAVPCTADTKCSEGLCVGEFKDCDDGSACTVDSCDEVTGVCQHAPLPDGTECDDGNLCTGEDKCAAGWCKGALPAPGPDVPPECVCGSDQDCAPLDDGNPCNGALFCNTDGGGFCDLDPASLPPCDDGVGCTDNLCDPVEGCINLPVHEVCVDDVDCTSDYCHPKGDCQNMGYGSNCDDGNDCTFDTCYVPGGCAHTPVQNTIPCGQPEGWGQCQAGECVCKWKCSDINCGDNGCGGTCGDCPGDLNQCVLGECQCKPDCSGKECGPNGCGGYCGGCDWEVSDCSDDFKCNCFYVECQNICCAIEEECVDGYCQNLINPPPVRISWGVVTPTTMEIVMENDVPVTGIQLLYSTLDATPFGGKVFELFPFIFFSENMLGALGIGNSIPPGKAVLVNLEFAPRQPGSMYCIMGDYNLFLGADGELKYQVIPQCYTWP